MGRGMPRPGALEAAARKLAAAQAVLHKVPAQRGRTAEDLVYEAWGKVRYMPDVVRVFVEGSPDLAELQVYERVVRCRAIKLTEPAIVYTRHGPVPAEPGQWVSEDLAGGLYTCDPAVFDAGGTAHLVDVDDQAGPG